MQLWALYVFHVKMEVVLCKRNLLHFHEIVNLLYEFEYVLNVRGNSNSVLSLYSNLV